MLLHTTMKLPISMTTVEELELLYKEGEDLEEIRYILGNVLSYPSTELAHLHRDSYRLGSLDLSEDHP